MIFINH